MAEKTPLAHVIEPGEYACLWQFEIDGVPYHLDGSVELLENRPSSGSVYGDLPLKSGLHGGIELPQTFIVPRAIARLRNGMTAALYDGMLETLFPGQAVVHATYALAGLFDDSEFDGSVGRARFQVGDLDRVTEIVPITRIVRPTEAEPEWRIRRADTLWMDWADDDVKLSLGYISLARVMDPWAADIAFSPVVTVDFNERVTVRELVEKWVEPLRGIVSTSTGRETGVTFASIAPSVQDAEQTSPGRWLQLFASGIAQEPYAARRRGDAPTNVGLRFGPAAGSLLIAIRHWQDRVAADHPLLSTYASVQGLRGDHPRSRFILLVQALEGLYGAETIVDREQKQADYDADREAALAEIDRFAEFALKVKKWLKAKLPKRAPASLEQALIWVTKSLPAPLTVRLADAEIVKKVIAEGAVSDWVNAIRVIRNDLSHGNRSFSAIELHELNLALDVVARAHVARLLGRPEPDVTAIVDRGLEP